MPLGAWAASVGLKTSVGSKDWVNDKLRVYLHPVKGEVAVLNSKRFIDGYNYHRRYQGIDRQYQVSSTLDRQLY